MIQAMAREPSLKSIEHLSIALWLGLCLLSLPFAGWNYALGIFLGGAIIFINFQWMHSQAKVAVMMTGRKGSAYMVIKYLFRLAVTAVVLYALIVYTEVNILALLIGVSVVMLSILAYTCFSIIFNKGE
jgi:hypothetical protein